MNIFEILLMPIGIIAFVLFLAGLWQINKGKNKRVTLFMRTGFGAILLYSLLGSLQRVILGDEPSDFSFEVFRTALSVLENVGLALFAWGFFLLAKDYREQ